MLLAGAGAILLLTSLFLEWYQPGAEAWDVFEVWDLVLAVLGVVALVAVLSRVGFGPPRPAAWLLGPAVAVLVIVLYALIDPPPLADALPDGDPTTGLWLALAAAVLLCAGALLSVARISVAITAAGAAAPAGATRRRGLFARDPYPHQTAPPPGPTVPGTPPPGPGTPPTEPTRRL